ncbi:MAG: alpha-glucosidase [Jiangellales bacterium]
MSDQPWWKSAVVYQIWPRSFADSDGDGIGDLAGVLGRLDYLAGLGVDALWLSPFYPSPQDDYGYDVADYQGVDEMFGTMDDVDALLAAVHERGMKLIVDVVLNHTSDEHPWFVESRSSRDNPKRDWYWWRERPNNWRSFFSVPAWTRDEQTGEYFLHLFSTKQPDLNWDNPQVRHALYAMLRWWLDRGVDGFRMDVINMISKDPTLPDGWAPPGETLGYGFEHFLYGPRIHDYLQEMHQEVFTGRDQTYLVVGEMPGAQVEQARLYTDPARGEVDMVFQFDHVGLDYGLAGKYDPKQLDLRGLKQSFGHWQSGLAEVGWNSLYWNNHDQPRIVSRWGDDSDAYRVASAKALGTLLHLHRGTPYVYQGEELGMTNYPFTRLDQLVDIEGLNWANEAVAAGRPVFDVMAGLRAHGRDNARTPMQWDDSPHAGFTTGTPWLAVNPNYPGLNAAAQLDDPDSVFAHYQRLISLRHSEPAVVDGDFTMLLPEHQQVYAFTRRLDHVELLVMVNVSSDEAEVEVETPSDWESAEVVLGSAYSPTMAPWEQRVLRRRR